MWLRAMFWLTNRTAIPSAAPHTTQAQKDAWQDGQSATQKSLCQRSPKSEKSVLQPRVIRLLRRFPRFAQRVNALLSQQWDQL